MIRAAAIAARTSVPAVGPSPARRVHWLKLAARAVLAALMLAWLATLGWLAIQALAWVLASLS